MTFNKKYSHYPKLLFEGKVGRRWFFINFFKWGLIFLLVGGALDIINILFENPLGIYDRGFNCLTILIILFPLNFIVVALIFIGIHLSVYKLVKNITNNFNKETLSTFCDRLADVWWGIIFMFVCFTSYIVILLEFFVGNTF